MFPNSSGLFFSLFLFIPIHAEGDSVSHLSKEIPTLIHLARGKNLRWMPPKCLPDASQMPFRCLSDASQMPPDASPKKLFGVSRWGNLDIQEGLDRSSQIPWTHPIWLSSRVYSDTIWLWAAHQRISQIHRVQVPIFCC